MSRQVNLYEAKTNLSQLVEDAAAGEEIVIAKNGKAKARLVAAEVAKPKKREFGQWAKYLTPEELKDLGSEDWWRRWKEADAEIVRDFEQGMEEDWKEYDAEWQATSSTQTRSSGRKKNPRSSVRKRLSKSRK